MVTQFGKHMKLLLSCKANNLHVKDEDLFFCPNIQIMIKSI
jgi:hypothetical protein